MGKGLKRFITYVIQAFFVSLIMSVIGVMIIAGILYKGIIGGDVLETTIFVLYFISALSGGVVIGRRIKKRKFLWGLMYGLVLFALILLIAYVANGGGSTNNRYVSLIICMIGGMLGGMFGGQISKNVT